MEWHLFWTILAQVAIATVSLTIFSFPIGIAISHLVRGVVRGLPKHNDVDAIADEVLDRIVVIGRDASE